MRPSKLYPFSIPANGSVNLLVSGDYFKIKSSTGSLTVTGDSFGNLENMLAGQGLRDTNFQRLTLTNETGAINTGFLLVSDSTFIDDRITGSVDIIDAIPPGVTSVSVSPSVAVTAFQSTQLLAPNITPNGYTIRSLYAFAQAGSGGALLLRVYAAPTNPSSFTPAGNQLIIADTYSGNTSLVLLDHFDMKKRIPANWGVWATSAVVTAAAAQLTISMSGESV